MELSRFVCVGGCVWVGVGVLAIYKSLLEKYLFNSIVPFQSLDY